MANRLDFEVGDTLTRAMGMFWRNLLPLGGCIALVSIMGIILQLVVGLALSGGDFGAIRESPSGLDSILTLLVTIASASFTSGVNGYAARLELKGEKPSFGGAWATGWRNLLPQMGITVLLWLMLLVGWTVLVIPGLILGTLFGMAPAAQIVEGKGVFAAFGDSLRASEGKRLALFGYYVVAYIAFLIVLAVLYGLLGAFALGGLAGAVASGGDSLAPWLIVVIAVIAIPLYIFLIGALPLALGSITSAAYASLRHDRSDESLSKVFD